MIKKIVQRIIKWIMANYESLKTAIRNAVYENGNNDVTGQGVQDVLIAIVNALGAGYQFTGVATPATDPGTPDVNVMYIAGAGTYPNFGATKVPQGSFGVFRYNGSWDYSVLDVASWADASNKLYYNTQAGNVAAKTIQADGFTLQPGGWIKIHFDNANEAANPTLNVNNTGAHSMTFNGRTVSATNSWKTGETVAFYYDNYGVGIWHGIRLVELPDFVNVNDLVGQSTPFASASAARTAIPQQNRKPGLNITYLLSTGENTSQWVQDMFIGDDVTDWSVADNWQVIGPVSVSQNTETGHTDINIGGVANPVASVKDITKLAQKENNDIAGLNLVVNGNGTFIVEEEQRLSSDTTGSSHFNVLPETLYCVYIKAQAALGQSAFVVFLENGSTRISNQVNLGDVDLTTERYVDLTSTNTEELSNCHVRISTSGVSSHSILNIKVERIAAQESLIDKINNNSEKIAELDSAVVSRLIRQTLTGSNINAGSSTKTVIVKRYDGNWKIGDKIKLTTDYYTLTGSGGYLDVFDLTNDTRLLMFTGGQQTKYCTLVQASQSIAIRIVTSSNSSITATVSIIAGLEREVELIEEQMAEFVNEDVTVNVDATQSQSNISGVEKRYYGDFKKGTMTEIEVLTVGDDNNIGYVDLYDETNGQRIRLLQNTSLAVGKKFYDTLAADSECIRVSYVAIAGHTLQAKVHVKIGVWAEISKNKEDIAALSSSTTDYIVDVNGGGDYTSLTECLQSINDSSPSKKYNIYIKEGTYDIAQEFWGSGQHTAVRGLIIPPYVNLIGMGPKENIILKAELSDDEAVGVATEFSTLNIKYSCTIKNLTIIAKNCRYAMHAETISKGSELVAINCKFIHKGTIQNTGVSRAGYGLGYPSASHLQFLTCEFVAEQSGYNPAFLCHDSNTSGSINLKPAILEFESCKFESQNLDGIDMYQKGYTGCGGDNIIFKGCEFAHQTHSVMCGLEAGHTLRTADFFAYACKNFDFYNMVGDGYDAMKVACV